VHAWLYWGDRILSGVGVAICHPRDTFDVDVGKPIAYGRAVKDAAQRLLDECVDETSPGPAKTLGDYIPSEGPEAFSLDGSDYAYDGTGTQDAPKWNGDLAEKVAELDSRVVNLECESEKLDKLSSYLSIRGSELSAAIDDLRSHNARATKEIEQLGSCERLDERRLTSLGQEIDTSRRRIERLCESLKERLAELEAASGGRS
jgi:hypothetical protein